MSTETVQTSEILAFNRWSTKDIVVEDPGLQRYITTHPRIVPKTGARYAGRRFHKSKIFIVERLINKIMIPGHRGGKHKLTSKSTTGKAITAMKIVENALIKVEQFTKENPIKVFVKAIENAAPREEIITVEYAGARYPKAVEMASQRRVDYSLKLFVQGSYQKSFKKKKSMSQALAEELIAAFEGNTQSAALGKKLELERQADASR